MIPPGWKEAHIGDVVTDLKSGLSRKLSSSDIGLPVIRSTNITDQGLLDLSDIKYWYREDPQGASTENYFLQAGDILVNFINSVAQIGKCALYQGELNRDTIYTTNIFCVRVHDRILPEYFLLLSRTREYAHYIHSITKPAVNQASFTTKDFKRFHFALPPLSEQRKIAEILDTWDQAIALTERRIEAARQRKKGLMQRLLTGRVRFPEFAGEEWQRVTLGQVSRFIRNGFSSRQNKLGKGYPVTRIETISNGSVNLNAVGYTEARIEQLEKYCLRKGDILFSHINSLKHIAKAAIFDGAEELYHGMNLLAIRLDEKCVDPRYIHYLLCTQEAKAYFQSRAKQAINQASLNSHDVAQFRFLLPGCQEQHRIVAVLRTCDREIELLTQKRDALQHQKKGLMQRLLTGRVRVEV